MVAGLCRYFVGLVLFACVWGAKVLLSTVFLGEALKRSE